MFNLSYFKNLFFKFFFIEYSDIIRNDPYLKKKYNNFFLENTNEAHIINHRKFRKLNYSKKKKIKDDILGRLNFYIYNKTNGK